MKSAWFGNGKRALAYFDNLRKWFISKQRRNQVIDDFQMIFYEYTEGGVYDAANVLCVERLFFFLSFISEEI